MDPSPPTQPAQTIEPQPPPAPPPLPPVGAPGPSPSRWPPLGAIVAAVALVGSVALIVLAVAGVGPFTASGPTAPPSPVPTSTGTLAATASASAAASPSPTAASSADVEAALAAIERRMTQIRELSAARSLPGKLVSSAEASRILVEDFHRDNPQQLIDDTTALDRALGLLTADQDLGELFGRFLSTQVLGFYRDSDKALYIVSDRGFGPLEQFTASHEYTHALQDAHFDLSKISPDAFDQGDRQLARTALIEGDATLAMTQWAISDLSSEELAQLFQQLQDPEAEQVLAAMPPIVRQTQEFPYSEGVKFVQSFWAKRGWSAVDEVWKNPPDTVEQVLHPEKYAADEQAVAVSLPAGVLTRLGSGWTLALQDTAGELVTRIWLEKALDTDAAATAVAGWGGDRLGYYKGPNGAWAVVWLTEWDTDAEARQFATSADPVVRGLAGSSSLRSGVPGTAVTVLVASDSTILSRVAGALPIP